MSTTMIHSIKSSEKAKMSFYLKELGIREVVWSTVTKLQEYDYGDNFQACYCRTGDMIDINDKESLQEYQILTLEVMV